MTRLTSALFAAAFMVASPAFAGSFSAAPFLPTLTFPSEASAPATKSQSTVLETCTVTKDTGKACAKALEDTSATAKASRGE